MKLFKPTAFFPLRRFCNSFCPPKSINVSVTIVNATNPTARIAALMLKQCKLIHELRLFDVEKDTKVMGQDLSHINTSTKVKAFTGARNFRDALQGTDIVLVCGGERSNPDQREEDLFEQNADDVRYAAMCTTEFCPKAIFCLSTPPINALIPMVSEEYKKAGVYDFRKIIGVANIGVVRANSIVSCYTNADPATMFCPVVGGISSKSLVPVLSQVKPQVNIGTLEKSLQTEISQAEDHVLKVKVKESAGGCNISSGYASSLFVSSLASALRKEKFPVECAYIRQPGHISEFLPYMASVVTLSHHGIQTVHMPKMNSRERSLLESAASNIAESIARGESYVTGIVRRKRRCKGYFRNTDLVQEAPVGGDDEPGRVYLQ